MGKQKMNKIKATGKAISRPGFVYAVDPAPPAEHGYIYTPKTPEEYLREAILDRLRDLAEKPEGSMEDVAQWFLAALNNGIEKGVLRPHDVVEWVQRYFGRWHAGEKPKGTSDWT